ncbi:MAG: chromate efflux transporter [Methanoregula sp.]|nr:chromate efflux transporter [Methanoregula sp.]
MTPSSSSMSRTNPTLVNIFTRFLRLGLTAFGGPAMVAYIRTMAVEREKWLDDATFNSGVSLCQTLPGATAMQVAAYTGLKVRGLAGAIAAFTGFGLPAFVLMMMLSALYFQTSSLPPVVSVFRGLAVIIVAIIATAAISFARISLKKWVHVVIAGIAAVLFLSGVTPILVILIAALLGLLIPGGDAPAPEPPRAGTTRGLEKGYFILIGLVAAMFLVLFFFSKELFELAAVMFRIDLFAFGGGFASLPLMYHEVVNAHAWLDSATFLSGIALGQVTPGPIVVTATFVGYLVAGFWGGVIATIAIFSPSFLLVVGAEPYFDRMQGSPRFRRAIRGILLSFVGLLLSVTIRFAMGISWDWPLVLLGAGAFIALLLGGEILWVVIAGVILSYLFF